MRTIEGSGRVVVLAVFLTAGGIVCPPLQAAKASSPASLSYDDPEALARDHARAFRVVTAPAARKKVALLLREYFTCVALLDGADSACDAVDSWIGDFAPASCKSRYRAFAKKMGAGRADRGKRRCGSAGRKALGAYAAALHDEREVSAEIWSGILEMRRRNQKAYEEAGARLDRDLAASAKERELAEAHRLEEERRLEEDRLEESRLEAARILEEKRVLEEESKRREESRRQQERLAEAEQEHKREDARAYQAAREADAQKRKKGGLPMRKKTR